MSQPSRSEARTEEHDHARRARDRRDIGLADRPPRPPRRRGATPPMGRPTPCSQHHESARLQPGTRHTSLDRRVLSHRPGSGARSGTSASSTAHNARAMPPRSSTSAKSLRGEATRPTCRPVSPPCIGPARHPAHASVLPPAVPTPRGTCTSRVALPIQRVHRSSAVKSQLSRQGVSRALGRRRVPDHRGYDSPASTSAGAFPSNCERARKNHLRIPNSLYEPARSPVINAIQ